MTGQELGVVLARGRYHALGDGILAWAAALGHLENSSRDTVAESNLVAVAVRGVVVADHTDRVLALGDRVVAVKDVPMGPVALVERDLERLGRDEDHELERGIVRVIVAAVRRLVRLKDEVRVRAALGRVLE